MNNSICESLPNCLQKHALCVWSVLNMKKRHVDTATKEGYGVNNIVILQFCTKLHCASQEQCHVCLGSHLTKLCLPCVVTSKMLLSMLGGSTIYVTFWVARYSRVHILQRGNRKAFLLDRSFLMLTGVYKKAIHLLPCTIPCTFQPNQCTTRLHAIHLSTT